VDLRHENLFLIVCCRVVYLCFDPNVQLVGFLFSWFTEAASSFIYVHFLIFFRGTSMLYVLIIYPRQSQEEFGREIFFDFIIQPPRQSEISQ
jgi:hypothetical protein